MKIALYTKSVKKDQLDLFQHIFSALNDLKIRFLLSDSFENKSEISLKGHIDFFYKHEDLIHQKIDFFISVGGDGTFLDALLYVRDLNIPILGFNTGRLGFLSYNPGNNIRKVFEDLISGNYFIDERSIISFITDKPVFGESSFALNDFTIHKRDNSSLTTITTYLNGEFFNTFWGDGVIVSTPTGSTAYSLSCGGPIVFPESNNFVITPVAPHNLNVRPVIVPDSMIISFEIKAREKKILISLDSRYKIVDHLFIIKVTKANFKLRTVRFKNQTFNRIIREKLMWGADNRNL